MKRVSLDIFNACIIIENNTCLIYTEIEGPRETENMDNEAASERTRRQSPVALRLLY
jgi:hypothetical protein